MRLYCYCVYEYVFILFILSYEIEHLPSQKALLLLSLGNVGLFYVLKEVNKLGRLACQLGL